MIHHPDYVKKLLWKFSSGIADPAERDQLKLARLIYTEEEILDMMASNLEEYSIDTEEDIITETLPIARSVIQKTETPYWKKHQMYLLFFSLLILSTAVLLLIIYLEKRSRPQALVPASITAVPYSVLTPVMVHTNPQEQKVMEFPGGSRIRLNAQSRVSVLPAGKDEVVSVYLEGECLLDLTASTDIRFQFCSNNATIRTGGVMLMMQSNRQYTSLTLVEGQCFVRSSGRQTAMQLDRPGEKLIIAQVKFLPLPGRDTLIYSRYSSIAQAMNWTRKERIYDGVSLRQYAADIDRWYGLGLTDLGCIPASCRIRTRLSYAAPAKEALKRITDRGVLLQPAELIQD